MNPGRKFGERGILGGYDYPEESLDGGGSSHGGKVFLLIFCMTSLHQLLVRSRVTSSTGT